MPKGTAFATKPALAVEMIERAIAAHMPFAWVATDVVYGVGDIEQALRRAGKGYVLGVKGGHRFGSWGDKPVVAGTAAQIASDLDPVAWHRLSAATAPREPGFTTGSISNSPTSKPTNIPMACPGRGPGVC